MNTYNVDKGKPSCNEVILRESWLWLSNGIISIHIQCLQHSVAWTCQIIWGLLWESHHPLLCLDLVAVVWCRSWANLNDFAISRSDSYLSSFWTLLELHFSKEFGPFKLLPLEAYTDMLCQCSRNRRLALSELLCGGSSRNKQDIAVPVKIVYRNALGCDNMWHMYYQEQYITNTTTTVIMIVKLIGKIY